MTSHDLTLRIDFGKVGYHSSKEAFCVTLEATPLAELIADARNVYRLYELFLIERPGDVWDYVNVHPEALPSRVQEAVTKAHAEADPRYKQPHPWPQDRLPLSVFDTLFSWQYDDTYPEAETWLQHRNAPIMQNFADQLLGLVGTARVELRNRNDPLRHHVVKRIESRQHAYAYEARAEAIHQCRKRGPHEAGFTESFYRQLASLLAERELASVAFRGTGDWRTMRMIATAQRKRAEATGHDCTLALNAAALTEAKINNTAWESRIALHDEGLAFGDLFIDTEGIGNNTKKVVEAGYRGRPRRILCERNHGPIRDYEMESGDGYCLYRRTESYGYRLGLDLIAERRPFATQPVFKFADEGKTVYSHEHGLIVVGQAIDHATRSALSPFIAHWQTANPRTRLLVQGDAAPFQRAGCKAIQMPEDAAAASEWLTSLLYGDLRWIDVLIGLALPAGADELLAHYLSQQNGPWDAFVVTSGATRHLHVDHALEGDLAALFANAGRLAR